MANFPFVQETHLSQKTELHAGWPWAEGCGLFPVWLPFSTEFIWCARPSLLPFIGSRTVMHLKAWSDKVCLLMGSPLEASLAQLSGFPVVLHTSPGPGAIGHSQTLLFLQWNVKTLALKWDRKYNLRCVLVKFCHRFCLASKSCDPMDWTPPGSSAMGFLGQEY